MSRPVLARDLRPGMMALRRRERRRGPHEIVVTLRFDFGPLVAAFRSFAAALIEAVDPRPTEHELRRYVIEHMDIAESDIKRIDRDGPTVYLKNWRRIPIEMPPPKLSRAVGCHLDSGRLG